MDKNTPGVPLRFVPAVWASEGQVTARSPKAAFARLIHLLGYFKLTRVLGLMCMRRPEFEPRSWTDGRRARTAATMWAAAASHPSSADPAARACARSRSAAHLKVGGAAQPAPHRSYSTCRCSSRHAYFLGTDPSIDPGQWGRGALRTCQSSARDLLLAFIMAAKLRATVRICHCCSGWDWSVCAAATASVSGARRLVNATLWHTTEFGSRLGTARRVDFPRRPLCDTAAHRVAVARAGAG